MNVCYPRAPTGGLFGFRWCDLYKILDEAVFDARKLLIVRRLAPCSGFDRAAASVMGET